MNLDSCDDAATESVRQAYVAMLKAQTGVLADSINVNVKCEVVVSNSNI
jgi:hypothetical protein